MKLSIVSVFVVLLLAISSDFLFAQRTVNVPQGFGTINNVIGGDTTETGARVDSNTVYILERDGTYILDGEFSPRYQVIIEAAEGSGAKPRIILGVPPGGTTPEQAIRPRADFYIKGCYVSAQDELGGMGTRIFRFEANGIKIVIDDCHLDIAAQAAFRINTDDNRLFMTNTIISNIGTMASPENGRAFDDRGNDVDSMYIENCTFYNLTFKILRDGGGRLNYAYFNQNTSVNTGFGAIDLGEALDVTLTNNIFINPVFLGTANEAGSAIELLPWTGSETPNIVIRNNNIITDPALVSAYPDTVKAPVAYDSLSNAYIVQGGFESSNISELLTFNSAPETPVAPMTSYWQGGQTDYDDLAPEDADFAYPNSAQSYTAGNSGQPLGDLNWFDMATGVEDYIAGVPGDFELYQNFPNPFNPSTRIAFSLPLNSQVSLKIYDMLGKEVAVLVNKEMTAGIHEINFDASQLSSGIYFYKIEAGNFISTQKMMLLK